MANGEISCINNPNRRACNPDRIIAKRKKPMTETPNRAALFISHASPEDNAFTRWLGAKLAAMGYEVWADVIRLHGGSDWSRELEEVLRKRTIKMLLVCTPAGLTKQGVRNEIEIGAQLAQALNDREFIIPHSPPASTV